MTNRHDHRKDNNLFVLKHRIHKIIEKDLEHEHLARDQMRNGYVAPCTVYRNGDEFCHMQMMDLLRPKDKLVKIIYIHREIFAQSKTRL